MFYKGDNSSVVVSRVFRTLGLQQRCCELCLLCFMSVFGLENKPISWWPAQGVEAEEIEMRCAPCLLAPRGSSWRKCGLQDWDHHVQELMPMKPHSCLCIAIPKHHHLFFFLSQAHLTAVAWKRFLESYCRWSVTTWHWGSLETVFLG